MICSSSEFKELKWIAGEFYWMESVQAYNEGGWDYITELHKFVQGGMTGTSFIDAVSGIVNRGCHNPVSSAIAMFHSTTIYGELHVAQYSYIIFIPYSFLHLHEHP